VTGSGHAKSLTAASLHALGRRRYRVCRGDARTKLIMSQKAAVLTLLSFHPLFKTLRYKDVEYS